MHITNASIQPIQNSIPNRNINLQTEVIIMGKTLSGILSAYFLSKNGRSVILVSSKNINEENIRQGTVYLTQTSDIYLQDLISRFGEEKAKKVWDSGIKTISTIQEIIQNENIDCDFEKASSFIYALDYTDLERLREEYNAAKKLKFNNIKFRNINKLGMGELGYLEIEDQAKFNLYKFTLALTQICVNNGVNFIDDNNIENIIENQDESITMLFPDKTITAKKIINTVIDSGYDIENLSEKITYSKKFTLNAFVPNENLPEAIFSSPNEPYFRFQICRNSGYDQIIFSHISSDYDTEEHFRIMEENLREIISNAKLEITDRYIENLVYSEDGLPLIGESLDYSNELIATAFGNNYVGSSVISALINNDILNNKENTFLDVYSPERTSSKFINVRSRLNGLLSRFKNHNENQKPSIKIKSISGGLNSLR